MEQEKNSFYCFGEALWDVYPDGAVAGGASLNVAGHLASMGKRVELITGVGDDSEGEDLIKFCRKHHIGIDFVTINDVYPTGKVLVSLKNGHPSYEIKESVAWDHILFDGKPEDNSVLLFGSLALRNEDSRSTLFNMVDSFKFKVFDLNLRLNYYADELILTCLQYCDILKINEDERLYLDRLLGSRDDVTLTRLFEEFHISLVLITRGADGAEAISATEKFFAPAKAVEAIDTVGCGDAFLACFVNHYYSGKTIAYSLEKAVELSGFIATKRGALPEYVYTEILETQIT
jgi:fructokinase